MPGLVVYARRIIPWVGHGESKAVGILAKPLKRQGILKLDSHAIAFGGADIHGSSGVVLTESGSCVDL